MIPTKAISPLNATAAAVPSVAATTTSEPHAARRCTPRLAASSSPTLSTSSSAPVQQDHDRADDDVRRDERDVVPARRLEPAEDPAVDLLQRLGVLLLHEGLHRGEERRRP